MTTTIRCSVAALAIAALVSLASFFAPATARAQCMMLSITNNTQCTVNLKLYDGTTIFTIHGITPGTASYPGLTPYAPTSIITALGNQVSALAACTGCVTLKEFNLPSTCCASVCGVGSCTITINPIVPCPASCQ